LRITAKEWFTGFLLSAIRKLSLKKGWKKKKWPIFSFTANRRKLSEGDGIVFYQAGIGGQKFLGQAEVASKIKKEGDKIDYFVGMKDVKVWKNHVEMHPLINSLDFIADKNAWGRHMQGGVRKLSRKDFTTIIKEAI